MLTLTTTVHRTLGDLTTPTAVYLRLRDKFPCTFLFESADYHSAADCRSFICCDPLAECCIDQGAYTISHLGTTTARGPVASATGLHQVISEFLASFTVESPPLPKGVHNGAFGYISWDGIEACEKILFSRPRDPHFSIPAARLMVFRYVLTFNHFTNELHILENSPTSAQRNASDTERLRAEIFQHSTPHFPFALQGPETSNMTDEQFLNLICVCKHHIARGDVFQIVPSRRFLQRFTGDDFQVYRALRSINPSPYLFYCDLGGYRLFGSSPEAQIVVQDGTASVFPIAGTYPRSGDDELDRTRAQQLLDDPKENSEHCMLVDLARNDLSRHCTQVSVKRYRETHFFSHVIHLVSAVAGTLKPGASTAQIISSTFPAGTLSGSPKHRALQILDQNEPTRRGHYGGCIGMFGFNGDAVLGIMIRSFLSMHETLLYQVGMGVVHDSDPRREIEETNAKIGALRKALHTASEGGLL
jgi:anthranilate synthase component 1